MELQDPITGLKGIGEKKLYRLRKQGFIQYRICCSITPDLMILLRNLSPDACWKKEPAARFMPVYCRYQVSDAFRDIRFLPRSCRQKMEKQFRRFGLTCLFCESVFRPAAAMFSAEPSAGKKTSGEWNSQSTLRWMHMKKCVMLCSPGILWYPV